MKTSLILISLLVPNLCLAQGSRLLTLSPTEATVAAIQRRVSLGETTALRDLASLEPVVAIPLLGRHIEREQWSNPASAQIARETLATFKGHGEFYRQKLADASGPHKEERGGERLDIFQTLSAIRTKEAVKAVAFFLWDEDTPAIHGSDYVLNSNKMSAAKVLSKMRLPNPPTPELWIDAGEGEILKWRAWWTAHQAQYQD